MLKKQIYILILFSLSSVRLYAETGLSRDSLVTAIAMLEKQPESIRRDKVLMFYYNDLCEKSIFGNDSLAANRMEQFRRAQEKSKWPIAKALYMRAVGKKYDKEGDYQKAIENYHGALEILEKSNSEPEHIVYTKILLGFIMLNSGDTEECYRLFQEAEPAALRLQNTSHAIWILDFYADNTLSQAKTKTDYEKALNYYKRAEKLLPKSLIKNQIPNNLQGQAMVYHLLGNEEKSEEYRHKALVQAKQIPNFFVLFNIYSDYAKIATDKRDFEKAIAYQKLSIEAANAQGYLEFKNRAYYGLYQAYKNAKMDKLALLTLEQYSILEDSLKRQKVNEKYAELEGKYNFEIQQSKIQELENRQLQYVLWALIILGFFSLAFAFYQIRTGKILKALNHDLEDRNRQIEDALITGKKLERKRVAEDLHDGLATKISALKWKIEAQEEQMESKTYDFITSQLEKLYNEVRIIAHNLLPLAFLDLGLEKSIEDLFSNLNNQGKINHVFETKTKLNLIPKTLQYHIFQFIVELSNNTQKHSNANKVWLSLENTEDKIKMLFKDDGQIKSDSAAGIGLKNIKSKVEGYGGKMVTSSLDGFEIAIEIPLSN